jgi:hypothetical protein
MHNQANVGKLTPQLDEYRRQFEALNEEAQELVAGLEQEQFNWRPQPGAWSIAECLDHLTTTNNQILDRIEERMQMAGRREVSDAKQVRHGFFGDWFIRTLEPPVKRKFRAPKLYLPPPERPPEKVISDFMQTQERIIKLIERASDFDLAKIKIASPVTRLLKLNLAAWFAGLAAHERRHLWQARQVKNHENFRF